MFKQGNFSPISALAKGDPPTVCCLLQIISRAQFVLYQHMRLGMYNTAIIKTDSRCSKGYLNKRLQNKV